MNKNLLSFTIGLLLLPASMMAQDKAKAIDSYFTALTGLKKFNGCIEVQIAGRPVIRKAYNLPGGAKSMLVTPESQFDIHSVSKLMANALLIRLQNEKKISIEAPLNKYIPGFPRGDQITISELMQHRSGLPRELSQTAGSRLKMSPEEIIAAIKKEKLEFEPGTSTLYSNLGYEVIYYIIARVTGMPFSAYLEQAVFQPLHMASSGAHFHASHTDLRHPAADHHLDGKQIVQVHNIDSSEFSTARIYSTTSDLMHYLNALDREPYRSALSNDKGVIEKNGGSDGVRAQIYTNTRLHYSFVLLSNFDGMPFQQTITDLVNILEDKPYVVPKEVNRKAIALPDSILKRCAGEYDFVEANHTLMSFKVENGQLLVYQDGQKQMTLLAERAYLFFEDPKSPDSFEFKNENGKMIVLWDYNGIRLKGARKN